MAELPKYVVSYAQFEDLSKKMQTLAQGLSPEQQAVLDNILVLADRHLAANENGDEFSAGSESGVQLEDPAWFRQSLATAFEKLVPGAFTGGGAHTSALADGTICQESGPRRS